MPHTTQQAAIAAKCSVRFAFFIVCLLPGLIEIKEAAVRFDSHNKKLKYIM